MANSAEGPKQKGRFLSFQPDGLSVVLPFGVGVQRGFCSFESSGAAKNPRVVARSNTDSKLSIQIYPPYSVVERMTLKGKSVKVRIWVVLSDLDRLRARQLIEREHYLMPTSRGLFLVCGIENDEARLGPKIIGVAVLDALMHGNPKLGHSQFATDTLGTDAWLNWPRNKIVEKLKLAWASRFAVHSDYQGCGIGTRLASHLKAVAREFRMPPANFIEVITTERKLTGKKGEEAASQGNFLVQAGYVRMDTPLKSTPLRLLNLKTGYMDPVSARKYYYYADIRKK